MSNSPGPGFETLGPLRHACVACGACCGGLYVRLRNDEEVRRIRAVGEDLGIEGAVDGQHLGRDPLRAVCVFLGADGLCEIHRRYGPEAKPWVCQQYPVVVVQTESVTRLDLDPGCLAHVRSWRTGSSLRVDAPLGLRRVPSPEEQRAEMAWLAAFELPGTTIANLLALACESRLDGGPGLPPGFATRLIHRYHEILPELLERLGSPELGPRSVAALAPVRAALPGWEAQDPPRWPILAPEEDAFAVDAIRRLLYLRITMGGIPIVAGTVMLALIGAVTCAWAVQEREAFGAAMGAWMRSLRVRAIWTLIAPDSETLSYLAVGDAPIRRAGAEGVSGA
jgi:Fe-S-cluster containining protein